MTNIISVTIEYAGGPVKIENGKIFLRQFGTTIYNKNMHYSWVEVPKEKLSKDLLKHLKENHLI